MDGEAGGVVGLVLSRACLPKVVYVALMTEWRGSREGRVVSVYTR